MESQASEVMLPQSAHDYFTAKFDPLWVQVLINLRMKHSKMFTRRRNSASEGWKLVFDELKESGAPEYVTIIKIKKKWMNLMTRYRQIKNTTLNPEMITWPYYEQMDKAFGQESELYSLGKNHDHAFNQTVSNDERQSFMKKLIELRYTHRHLFTGRKYTARDGWMIIQSLLQCQGKYSVDQLSKCWQNLVQRYKQLSKNESNQIITWPYFEHMHKWFEESKVTEAMKIETEESENVIESEDKNEEVNDPQLVDSFQELRKNNISIECIKIQLLSEIKVAQEKNHAAVMEAMKNIGEKLNRLTRNETRLDSAAKPDNENV
ncbi:uncharacterized protein isoform X2 [Leptinotarsa decemlineata]|uniref:uncharacterized protein isoform X2 n=1 Tax=Leptinotarsa decemlineata TaxID=7539 RepID=UPI003D304AF2